MQNKELKTKIIKFSLQSAEAQKVSLFGEFNNWNPDADPMQRDEKGTWTLTKMFSSGNKKYKFWILEQHRRSHLIRHVKSDEFTSHLKNFSKIIEQPSRTKKSSRYGIRSEQPIS